MKRDHFAVIFANHNIQNVIAGSKKEAIVLAQAQQIEAGLDYNVEAVFMESARTADDEIVKWKKEGEIV